MNKFKFYTLCLLFCSFLSSFIFISVHAEDYGLGSTARSAGLDTVGSTSDVTQFTGQIVGTALSMIGILFFLLMIYAGLRWMTARGNSELTQKAQDTIIAATIGMVIVLASYAITTFVFNAVPTTTPATTQTTSP